MEEQEFIDHMAAIGQADVGIETKIMTWLQLLAGVRQSMLGKELMRRHGKKVLGGPFKGMELTIDNPSTFHLMGFYETPMQPCVEELASTPYEYILNLGSSFGYYSVGFALRNPKAKIINYEIDDQIRDLCIQMAKTNGVMDRFDFRGAADGNDFAEFKDQRTLIFCDIEGMEEEILDPEKFPELIKMDMLVELHDCIVPNISTTLSNRFAKSHDVTIMENNRIDVQLPDMFKELSSMDQVIACWDGRSGPTPWGLFKAKNL